MVTVVNDLLTINEVPLEKIYLEKGLIIELDDELEKRWKIKFSPYQGIKITTADCFDFTTIHVDGKYKRNLLVVHDSDWIKELKSILSDNDRNATFIDKANHYILPLGDNIVEIIAWKYEIV